MESNEIIIASIISLVFGFIAGWMVLVNQKAREKKIRKKIAEIEYQEKLIESISNGYKNLLRHAFKSISISLFLVFSSTTAIIALKVIPFPPFMEQLIWTISLTMWGIAAAICLSTFNEIASLNDLDKTKEKLNNKKEKLESKL
tara:strand:+ start:13977 stop:14408 length:432 start_codon:yes stop_codon:yes gene_type:complete